MKGLQASSDQYRYGPPPLPARQNGMALLVVLVLFSILFTISVQIMYEQDRARTRSANLVEWNKRWQYGLSAEVVALQALADDLEEDAEDQQYADDCNKEHWAINLPAAPYEDAIVSATVQDLQSRFNLNWLVELEGDKWVVDADARESLEQLLSDYTADTGLNPETISYEMADWVDSDNVINGIAGAEDAEYRSHRTPNIPVAHESELRSLFQFQSGAGLLVEQLQPYLVSLPSFIPLNINTASEKVLSSYLSTWASSELVAEIIKQRSEGPFSKMEQLYTLPAASGLTEDDRIQFEEKLSVASSFFQIQVQVAVNGRPMRMESRIYRGRDGTIKVIGRRMMPLTEKMQPSCNPDGGV